MNFDRKAEIIQLAIELVKNSGFDSFSYSNLAAQLGIRKASIHHHFPRKEDLGIAMLDTIRDSYSAMLDGLLARHGTAVDKLNTVFDLGREMCESGKLICPVSSLQADTTSSPQA